MRFSIKQIAEIIGGEVIGDENIDIFNLAKIDEEAPDGSITFIANPKYENYLYTTNAKAVIIKKGLNLKQKIKPSLILVDDPYNAFTILLKEYEKVLNQLNSDSHKGIEQPSYIGNNVKQGTDIYIAAFAYISPNCELGNNVKIYPHSYIGENVKIGDYTIIHAGAKIYPNTEIGKNCIIHAGAVIGSEGFGFAPQADGTYQNIPQLGKVILEDNVSIGANTTIDRATMGTTLIEMGAKLDNLIQIGHNVRIGKNTVMAAQSGIAGSTKIGNNCAIGGQVGIVNSINIADFTKIGAQSGINGNIKEKGTTIIGSPAVDYKNFMKSSVIFRKLPELQKRLDELEQKIKKQ